MRILVTGGAGFIGSHLVDALVGGGYQVRVLDSLSPAAHAEPPGYLNPAADYIIGDVGHPGTVRAAVEGMEAVAHPAGRVGLGDGAYDLVGYVTDNDVGTAVLLDALGQARSRARLVLASSMVVYGEGGYRCPGHGRVRPGPRLSEDMDAGRFEPTCPSCGAVLVPVLVSEDELVDPRNVYAATKAHQEHLATAFSRSQGVSLAILRYHNVYGPRMPRDTPYAGVASLFCSALARGQAPAVYEDGNQRRDFVHVADVAAATVAALVSGATGAFNVGSGRPTTVGQVAEALCTAWGPGAPSPIVTGRYRLGDVRHVVASVQRAAELLGFEAGVELASGRAELAALLRSGRGLRARVNPGHGGSATPDPAPALVSRRP